MTTMLNATHIEVAADVRYWEDATVNGVEDADGNLIPGSDGKTWRAVIDLAAGRVESWPTGTIADIHYKVCDAGEYWLLCDGERIAKWGGYYVPDEFLCHGDEGFGDYIILKVGADGGIVDYKRPEIDPARWRAVPEGRGDG